MAIDEVYIRPLDGTSTDGVGNGVAAVKGIVFQASDEAEFPDGWLLRGTIKMVRSIEMED